MARGCEFRAPFFYCQAAVLDAKDLLTVEEVELLDELSKKPRDSIPLELTHGPMVRKCSEPPHADLMEGMSDEFKHNWLIFLHPILIQRDIDICDSVLERWGFESNFRAACKEANLNGVRLLLIDSCLSGWLTSEELWITPTKKDKREDT